MHPPHDIRSEKSGQGPEKEEKKHRTEDRDYRFSKRRQRGSSTPPRSNDRGENMRQLEIKAGSARKITGSPDDLRAAKKEVDESFRFFFLLLLFLFLSFFFFLTLSRQINMRIP